MERLAELAVEEHGDVAVVRVEGEIDISNVTSIADEVMRRMEDGAQSLVLDLSPTTYVDSSGLRLLFELQRRLGEAHRGLCVVVPEDAPVRRLLALTRVEDILPIVGSVEEALAAQRSRGDGG
jgi:anti-anti-sigma factor